MARLSTTHQHRAFHALSCAAFKGNTHSHPSCSSWQAIGGFGLVGGSLLGQPVLARRCALMLFVLTLAVRCPFLPYHPSPPREKPPASSQRRPAHAPPSPPLPATTHTRPRRFKCCRTPHTHAHALRHRRRAPAALPAPRRLIPAPAACRGTRLDRSFRSRGVGLARPARRPGRNDMLRATGDGARSRGQPRAGGFDGRRRGAKGSDSQGAKRSDSEGRWRRITGGSRPTRSVPGAGGRAAARPGGPGRRACDGRARNRRNRTGARGAPAAMGAALSRAAAPSAASGAAQTLGGARAGRKRH